jgi:hypothetical protein
MMRQFVALAVLTWACAGLAQAQTDGGDETAATPDPDAPTVGASLDKTEAFVGDRLTLTVSAVAKAGVAVTLPPKLALGKLEVLDRADSDRQGRDLGDGRRAHRFILGVAAYEVGELELPALPLSYINPRGEVRSVETAPVSLRIRALVADDERQPEVQPPRPPRSALVEDKRVMRALRWGGAALGGALALLVMGLALRRVSRRAAVEAAVAAPTRPPEEVALERLQALRAAGRFSVDEYRPFTFEVAEVVRAYLGARYGFDSLELTTTELLAELTARAPEVAGGEAVGRFLADTDLVKFANAGSTDGEALAWLDAAESIVRATTPAPAPPAAPAAPSPPVAKEAGAGG